MDIAETIYQQVKTLPISKAIEVLDFIEFLQMKLDTETDGTPKLSKPINFDIELLAEHHSPKTTIETNAVSKPEPELKYAPQQQPTESEKPNPVNKTAETENPAEIELDDEFKALRDEWLSH